MPNSCEPTRSDSPGLPAAADCGLRLPRLFVISVDGASARLPVHEAVGSLEQPDAVIVVTRDESRPSLWRGVTAPVIVVLPSNADAFAVTRAFAAGADACVRTESAAELGAHLSALLRRHRCWTPASQ